MWDTSDWAKECANLERQYNFLKEDYSEIARALGFEGDQLSEDKFVCHAEIVAKVKELVDGS